MEFHVLYDKPMAPMNADSMHNPGIQPDIDAAAAGLEAPATSDYRAARAGRIQLPGNVY